MPIGFRVGDVTSRTREASLEINSVEVTLLGILGLGLSTGIVPIIERSRFIEARIV